MAATLIPLTTTFTPPSDCLAAITADSFGYLLLGSGTSCRPSGAGRSSDTQWFSPAPMCPESWTPAASETITIGSVYETRATCCPVLPETDYTVDSRFYVESAYYYECTAWITPPFPFLYITSDSSELTTLPAEITTRTTTDSVGGIATTTYEYVSDYYTLQAQAVMIAWQESDLPGHSSSSTSSSGLTSTSSASPASTSAAVKHPSSGGLSTTDKIIIGVVVPVVVLAALALGIFLIMRRRKSKRGTPAREIQQEIVQNGYGSPIESKHDAGYGASQDGYGRDSRQGYRDDRGSFSDRTSELPHYSSPLMSSPRSR